MPDVRAGLPDPRFTARYQAKRSWHIADTGDVPVTAMCTIHLVLDHSTITVDLTEIPEDRKCKRSGCARMWPNV